jgi:REP element-mobilizing transposase RayT
MNTNEYRPHELRFAYCYRVYFRWQTYRGRPNQSLRSLTKTILDSLVQSYGIRILECSVELTDIVVLVSLKPTETISACAGKLKGRVSKWLNQQLDLSTPSLLLSRSYFAYTTGPSSREAIEKYLDDQGVHHGYANRDRPPIFVESYIEQIDERRLSSKHALVIAKFHIVLCAKFRRGVFGSSEGRLVTEEWRRREVELKMGILKVSFVPDHVHIAIRLHPEVSPAEAVAALMNSAQEILGGRGILQESAYIGSFGELTSPEISRYVRRAFEE